MINAHGGKGRYLQPENFSMELFLMFNLGPLHKLDSLVEDIIKSKGKQYFRKFRPRNAQYGTLISSAMHNHRREEEEKAKLPLDIWQK